MRVKRVVRIHPLKGLSSPSPWCNLIALKLKREQEKQEISNNKKVNGKKIFSKAIQKVGKGEQKKKVEEKVVDKLFLN